MDPIQARFDLAMDLALDAALLILPKFQSQFQTELKDDGSYVTEVDKAVEKEIRENLADHFPDDGIIGEEYGTTESKNSYTWTLDPIDGTSSFVHGVPLFGTMIGLLQDEVPVFGIIHFPGLSETYYAIKNKGAFWKSSHMTHFISCVASKCDNPKEAMLCYSDKVYFEMFGEEKLLKNLQESVGKERVWGDCYGHMLVATGRADIMIDPYFYTWDLIPVKIIVEEAGGHVIDTPHPDRSDIFRGISCSQKLKGLVEKFL